MAKRRPAASSAVAPGAAADPEAPNYRATFKRPLRELSQRPLEPEKPAAALPKEPEPERPAAALPEVPEPAALGEVSEQAHPAQEADYDFDGEEQLVMLGVC